MQKNYVRIGRKRRLGGLSLALGLSCLVALPSLCAADATGQIVSYQGLLSAGGAPVANGNQSLTFKIYENNAVVFTVTQTVATVGGVFNAFVNIGNLSFDPAKTYELGITFNGTEARHPIAAVPVAKNAQTAEVAKTVQAPLSLSGNTTGAILSVTNNNSAGTAIVATGKVSASGEINSTSGYSIAGSRILGAAGTYNAFVGLGAGSANTTGSNNTFIGGLSGNANTTGGSNAFLGRSAGVLNTTGSSNAFVGSLSGSANTTGAGNAFVGTQAGSGNTSGSLNVFLGRLAGNGNTTGGSNIALGSSAGINLTTGSNNIAIGHAGVAGESATTRIGTQGTQTRAFIAGISGVAVTGAPVVVNSSGQLGTGTVGIANGGTGSATQNFVDLTTDQTVGGNKTFTSPINTSNQYNIGGNRVLSVAGSNNAFVGAGAGAANTDGQFNTFVGASAGQANTTGSNNAFVGDRTGLASTTGASNTFVGSYAGAANTTGSSNSFIGSGAGAANTEGSFNLALGYSAGAANTTGVTNIFIGTGSGSSNTTGGVNTFIGADAGKSNTTGGSNIALGLEAGKNLTTGSNNIAIGNGGVADEAATTRIGTEGTQTRAFIAGISGVGLVGSTVVVDANGQLGVANGTPGSTAQNFVDLTTDQTIGGNKTFTSPVNTSTQYNIGGSRVLSAAGSNAFVGIGAGTANTSGTQNTFVGQSAGSTNSGGNFNTFVGTNTGRANSFGQYNTYIGSDVGLKSTTGDNTFVGARAGYSNTEGSENSFFGVSSGGGNITGTENSFFGYYSGISNATGRGNTFVGQGAGYSNKTAHYNTFVGENSGRNTNANLNVFIGESAGYKNTTGAENIAVGYLAGSELTTGGGNIDIGSAGVAGEATTIRLGTPNQHTRTFIAGISGVAVTGAPVVVDANGQLGTSISSSRRFKQDIADIGNSSNWLMRLRPVSFRYTPAFLKSNAPSSMQYGLIAEEVAKVHPQMVHFDAQGRPDGLSYQDLPVLLLNEVQKQQRTIDEQQRSISALRTYVARLDSSRNARGNFTGGLRLGGGSSPSPSPSGGLLQTIALRKPLDNRGIAASDESAARPNIFNGTVMLDAKGEAVVSVPEGFGVVGRELSYQLTCVGGYAPVYVSQELADNRFKISGGKPGMKVSWQVASTH